MNFLLVLCQNIHRYFALTFYWLNSGMFYKLNRMKQEINLIFFLILIFAGACGNTRQNQSDKNKGSIKIVQKEDGTISLHLESAVCYSNKINPSLNTAEWNIVVSKPGRYNVWLVSATKDTMNLGYSDPVRIELNGERIETRPVGNKIVLNEKNIKSPYYRADSYMGSFYIDSPGEYSLQVISEKIVALDNSNKWQDISENTILMSVVLTPMSR